MPRYVKKPIEVEAIEFIEENFDTLMDDPWNVLIFDRNNPAEGEGSHFGWIKDEHARVQQIEIGDFVALDVENKPYVIRRTVFEQTYEKVDS